MGVQKNLRPGEGLARPHLEETWGLELGSAIVIASVVLAAVLVFLRDQVHALEGGQVCFAALGDGESTAVGGIVSGLVLVGVLAEVGVGAAQVVTACGKGGTRNGYEGCERNEKGLHFGLSFWCLELSLK